MSIQTREVFRLKQKLDYIFELSRKLPDEPMEIRSHWARYLCIQLSGFLEISVRIILTQYIVANSSPKIQKYVLAKIKGFQNPKSAKISELVGSFQKPWRERLERSDLERARQDIDSVVTNRNQIAHGDDTPNLRLSREQEWYPNIIDYIEALEKLII